MAEAEASGALGMYFDSKAREFVVVVPASGDSTFSASDVSRLAVPVRVESRDIDQPTIGRISRLLEEMRPELGEYEYGFGFDPESGTVWLGSEAPKSTFESVLKEFPGKVSFSLGEFHLASMANDPQPHSGGAHTNGSQGCTSGYAHRLANGQVVMVEAGHCFANAEITNFGIVQRVMSIYPNWDVELILGHEYQGRICRTADLTQPVVNAFNPTVGVSYCTTGRSTGIKCDWTVTALNMTICYWQNYPSGACAHNLAQFNTSDGDPIIGGDSGGPLWFRYTNPNRAGIRGVISGYFWDVGSFQWRNYATQYVTIANLYGGGALIP